MWVIDHFFYAGLYLPACSCFTDCPCSRDWGPYGTAVYWRFDYTADEVLLFLWNLLEEEHYTSAVNYKAFTRLSLNSKSVFRCSNKAAGTGWGFAVAQEPSLPKLDLRLPSTSSRQLRREGMFIMMQKRLSETQSQHFPAIFTACRGECISIEQFNWGKSCKGEKLANPALKKKKGSPEVSHKQENFLISTMPL